MKLNAAVIGAGIMGKNHARVYSKLGNVNLVAVCDSDKENGKKIAEMHNARFYANHKEMIEKEELDAVSVCVPTVYHKDVAIDVLRKKINVLVEKPIAADLEDGKIMVNEAERNNVKLMVGHIERFNPVVKELKKRIERNELGKIYKVHCARLSQFPQRIRDVGVIIDLAIHEIDILRYIVESKIKRVYAETAQRVHSTHEDLLIGVIRFDNSILGVINANWLSPKKVREITVTGEKGMFVANYLTQELDFYEKEFAQKNFKYDKKFILGTGGRRRSIKIKSSEPLENELKSFVGCIQKGLEPEVSGNDGLSALEIAQKFLESSKNSRVVEL